MKKIRSEFLTETEANSAMEQISSYCGNIRVTCDYDNSHSGGNFDADYGHDGYNNYMRGSDFFGFPETGAFGLGGFGMISGWNLGSYGLTDQYRHTFPHYSHLRYDLSRRASLEAEVADDNYEYIRDKLYALGAVTVS